MMHTSSSPLGSWAAGKSASSAYAGALVAGGTTIFGKSMPLRYAAVRVGADADAQSVGIRGEFTRGVQHSIQADALKRAA